MGGGGKSGGNPVIGYRYYMGLQMGICRGPIDEIVEIRVGDKTAFPWSEGGGTFAFGIWFPGGPTNTYSDTITSTGTYSIVAGALFGGDQKEGGIHGSFTVMMGHQEQIYPDWIKAKLGGLVPDFRGVVTCYFDGLVCSLNPYPKPWKIRHRRTVSGWDGDVWAPHLATIWLADGRIKAMNPAHILYECATNGDWGRGLPRSRIDEASWLYAANVLNDEAFGLCLRWNRRDTLQDFVQMVLNHIGGGIHVDRETGLLRLDLIRGDYDPDDLPLFDYNSGLLSIDSGETAARDNSVNEIVVKYHDPITDKDGEVRAQNLASIQSLGAINSSTISYSGIPTFGLAARVAQRDLRASTAALRRYKITLDRHAWRIYPGALFRISAPDRGIVNLILRAGKITESGMGDGKIVVEAVIDVFGLPAAAFIEPQEPAWESPSTFPMIPEHRLVREATYRDLYLRLSPADMEFVTTDSAAIATMAAKPSSLSLSYSIATKVGTESFVTRRSDAFSPIVILSDDVGPYDTELAFDQSVDIGLIEAGDLIQLGSEILLLEEIDVDTSTITVKRGCIDTVPVPHAAESVAFFISDPIGTDGREYVSGETVTARLLTTTSGGTLPVSVAPDNPIDMIARQARPYPPGNVRVNDEPCHNVDEVDGVLNITWTHRDRLTQADQIVSHFEPNIGPEDGTTYRLSIYNASSNTLLVVLPAMGTSIFIHEDFTGPLRFELEAVRDSLTSAQKHVFSLTRT